MLHAVPVVPPACSLLRLSNTCMDSVLGVLRTLTVAPKNGWASPTTSPPALSAVAPPPNSSGGCVHSTTPTMHSGITAAAAGLTASRRSHGLSSATMRGAKKENVVAVAMGRR